MKVDQQLEEIGKVIAKNLNQIKSLDYDYTRETALNVEKAKALLKDSEKDYDDVADKILKDIKRPDGETQA